MPVPTKFAPSPRSAKAVQVEPERLYGGKDMWNRW